MTPTDYTNLENDFETVVYPTRTYALDVEKNRIKGFTDGLKAMEQAVYIILMTERFKHVIYSFNYGFEFEDIADRLYPYAYSVIRQHISEALLADDRIIRVYDFNFERGRDHGLLVRFTVTTTEGEMKSEVAV